MGRNDGGATNEALVNESLSKASSRVSLAHVEGIVHQHYGIHGQATVMTSERDQNFKITAPDGREFAFRVSNPAEPPEVNDFQLAAMQHIACADPDLPVPRVIRTLNGEAHLSLPFDKGELRSVRMISYLPGDVMLGVPRSAALRHNLGDALARMGHALRDFHHPGAFHELAWDLKHTPRVRGLLEHIDDAELRALTQSFADTFVTRVAPVLPTLRAQVVHNDLNLHNVLVDPAQPERVVGILDFGDLVHTALIVDVAVGASYHFADSATDPWLKVIEFVTAYHARVPLSAQELDLLYDLIAARYVVTIAITGWRAKRYPENGGYILKNHARSCTGLHLLSILNRDDASARLRLACNME
ncbi:hypothetical protein WM40_19885 [Robbsia andropogonis]|uniref:Hydroxylysine kinase n=1 Tax=Robbsia andropogonis TaxID=28092 RepID=A0A0F5JXQ9_9BURK|nr:phosphotransferase [Robbsia andropogonis]KKB62047.1 hypothetical protein WM40_19885 [Robbsia andropogonis]